MKSVEELKVKIFADGADIAGILEMYKKPFIKGFTTNPTLMRQAGLSNYETFAREVLKIITDLPISFEVLSDDFDEMKKQALFISSWAKNVYVKIPVTNTLGVPSYDLITDLVQSGVKLNVTAIMAMEQIREVSKSLKNDMPSVISVFAGRIADTGRDPVPFMTAARELISTYPSQELLWASPRELLNIFQADEIGCHIITVTNDILRKLPGVGKDLSEFSLDTVKMFRSDAVKAGFTLEI
ncbi:MAG: transaldolase [Geobacteraceae bacterium]|nr:transaldolase [Geobacteraceae bacterium]